MALNAPPLDDRKFQQIVDEAKKRIPHFTPEWTDHNVSDPGITLVELFAWMVELILYRMNQVPDLHYVKFMEMFGVGLNPPQAARTALTFWFSKALAEPTGGVPSIAAYTAVSTVQTETVEPVIFTTDDLFEVQVPVLRACITSVTTDKGTQYVDYTLDTLHKKLARVPVFASTPTPKIGDALYWGFSNDLSFHLVCLTLTVEPNAGFGINNKQPPYEWQVSNGNDGWEPINPTDIEFNEIKGLNDNGRIQFHLPQMGRQKIKITNVGNATQPEKVYDLYWVRVRVRDISSDDLALKMTSYTKSPLLLGFDAPAVLGCTIQATHAAVKKDENLGESDGSPGQRFFLQFTPLLAPRLQDKGERLLVRVNGVDQDEDWHEVTDFGDSCEDSPDYMLDSVTGELRLGPAIRQRDGAIRRYGRVPARGAQLIFQSYRYGGGIIGNVKQGELNTLKTAIPYVKQVRNRHSATGGLDQQTLEAAKLEMPRRLRTIERAVTAEDFEFLAQQPEVGVHFGRVKCFQPKSDAAENIAPGTVELLLMAHVPDAQGQLTGAQLQTSAEDKAKLRNFLDQRRLLTTRLVIAEPSYHYASVLVTIHPPIGMNQNEVRKSIRRQLYHFLNPLIGGFDGLGWPFGRKLQPQDIYRCLQDIEGVQAITDVKLFEASSIPADLDQEAVSEILLPRHGVILSGQHDVSFVLL